MHKACQVSVSWIQRRTLTVESTEAASRAVLRLCPLLHEDAAQVSNEINKLRREPAQAIPS